METMLSEFIQNLIHSFSIENLQEVLFAKNQDFELYQERLFDFEDEFFTEAYEIGKVKLKDNSLLKTYAIKVNTELTERTSKKKQFDFAKKILNSETGLDAGIFTFFDENGNFRFSLVYKVYKGTKKEFSHYKRHTYFIEKGRPYRTFLKSIIDADFTTLENLISAFSTRPLTKEFYTEIQNWYAWALKHAWFPGGKLEENLIRLITRLIFVWFLKEKKLIPEEIFDPEFLNKVIKDFGKADYYYNVILQNLFFATLNQYPQDRRFAKNRSFLENRTEFGVKTLFRYQDKLLISEDEFIKIFEKVPFINGGLFECLDEDSNYIDGFSRNEKKRAKLPDFLFFSDEKKEDLSSFYGTKKTETVRGLINILKDYNFTADENSPIDIEVSLDPELLGHIFENLLASYNPETATTARKATGSYYTPKEIVEFMVEESLIECLKTKTGIEEEKLRRIFSYEEEKTDLSQKEKERLINAIDSLKVIDPAVGSGAFPMSILHKLVHVLGKIDPENELWYELQYQKALREVEEVLKIKDKDERERLLREINESFDDTINYPDYARKLYLIENCIYGVDVQPIAIQICKLRFFLSLLIDQRISSKKENYGIKPLPHLETKFVSANTLIGLEKAQKNLIEAGKVAELKKRLKELYKRHFRIKTRTEKKRLQKKAQAIRQKIKELLVKNQWREETVEKIANFDIFDQTTSVDWFDPEWMFGVEDGFDIVIGNPPYVRQERIKEIKPILKNQGYKTFVSTADLYVYFYEKGFDLLKNEGILCFISSNKWMRAKYGENLRKFLKENTQVLKLIDFSGYRVFAQTVDTCIVLLKKRTQGKNKISFAVVNSDVKNPIEYVQENWKFLPQEKLSLHTWILADEKVLALKEKIEKIGKPLKEWDVKIYRGVLTGFNEAFIIDTETRTKILANCKTEEERRKTEKLIKPVLRGRDIKRYCYKWAGLWLILIPAGWTNKNKRQKTGEEFFRTSFASVYKYLKEIGNKVKGKGKGLFNRDDQGDYWWELRPCDYYPEFEKEKIVWQRVTQRPKFAIVPSGILCENTTHFITGSHLEFLIGVLNSKLFEFGFYKFYMGGGIEGEIKGEFIGRFPIPPVTSNNHQIVSQIIKLVDEIFNLKQTHSCSVNTTKLENQIDQLVYKLYNLTQEEIELIEKSIS